MEGRVETADNELRNLVDMRKKHVITAIFCLILFSVAAPTHARRIKNNAYDSL